MARIGQAMPGPENAVSTLAASLAPRSYAWRRAMRNGPLVAGAALVALLVLTAALAPVLASASPYAINLNDTLLPPSLAHLAGTDAFGRDQMSRILFGGRIALAVGVIAVGISLLIGGAFGLVSGIVGGLFDSLVLRLMDVMLAFPTLLLAFLVIAVLGPGVTNAVIAIGIGGIPVYARVMRGEVLKLRNREYVEAARATGAGMARLLMRHILPNALGPILVLAGLGVATAILTESALSYIGLGAQVPSADWGSMLSSAQDYIETQWWLPTFPGIAIVLASLGFNLMGDGMRDLLDPR